MGIALVLAFGAGKLAHFARIPQVSAYILVGVLLGPSALNLMTIEAAESLNGIKELAFGLILFNIGGEFHRGLFQKVTRTHLKFSVVYATIIFIVVSVICFLFSLYTDMTMVQKLVYASFLGIVAIAAAPPTVLLVIKEFDAKGPLTKSLMVFLAVGTIISILGAHATTSFYQAVGFWQGSSSHSVIIQFFLMIWAVIGSVLVGILLGILLSLWEQKETVESELLFAVICALLFGQTLAHYLKLEPLLVSLCIGFALVNTSPAGQAIHYRVKGMGLSIYALFFVLAGAHIHLQTQIKTVGLLGLGYIFARSAGMIFGARFAANKTGESPMIGKNMGFGVLSHAGAALAIIAPLQGQTDLAAQNIVTVVLASIFVFEILGPLILRFTLIRVGEISIGALIGGAPSRATLTVTELMQNCLENLGIVKPKDIPHLETIKLLVDRKIYAIDSKANIKEVINFVDKHHFPLYPVVDQEFKYKGIISISDLKDVIFDPFYSRLTNANKLIGSRACLTEDSTFDEAVGTFGEFGIEVLPVVHPNSQKLVGTLSYKSLVISRKPDEKEQ